VLAKQVLSQLSYTPTSTELLTFYDTLRCNFFLIFLLRFRYIRDK
jgi:hypothetical protein